MTTTTANLSLSLDLFRRFFGAVAAFSEGINEGREMAARYDRLSKLSDQDLARRGLSRDQIVQFVVNGRSV